MLLYNFRKVFVGEVELETSINLGRVRQYSILFKLFFEAKKFVEISNI